MWTDGQRERYFEVNGDLGWEGPGNITQSSDVYLFIYLMLFNSPLTMVNHTWIHWFYGLSASYGPQFNTLLLFGDTFGPRLQACQHTVRVRPFDGWRGARLSAVRGTVTQYLCRFSSFVLKVKCPSQSACPELVREIAVMSPVVAQCGGNRISSRGVCSKWRCGATDRQTDTPLLNPECSCVSCQYNGRSLKRLTVNLNISRVIK